MRGIKFRVWKEEFNSMLYLPEGYLDQHRNPMQYTGLKDKNGKEIYEGDVLSNKAVVKFGNYEDDEGYSTLEHLGFYMYLDGDTHSLADFRGEVIGNIYENSELVGGV